MKPDLPIEEAPVPAIHRAKKPRKRAIRHFAVGAADQAIGPITPGCEIFAMTNGQFSIVDILEHCLSTTGPASLDIATWTAADGDLRRAHAFLLSQTVTRARFVVDPSFRTRKPEFCETLVGLFGNDAIRTTPLHGKFALLRNAEWSLAIRTSMNLNVNRRIESVEISDDPALGEFLERFVDDVFGRSPDANFASQPLNQNARHDIKSKLAF